ncbi:thiamine pyrophosphate-binding protein [Ruminococcus flavefaciens]|uniref:thiamine pyrophosphate-binding protein n=1 Tax=Ruminococcus flavefaciens TaxID=1265 RepID=UPI0004653A53|nr:thiamine pyrophosphate-binding protein [Ruminococcus flavefaciens]
MKQRVSDYIADFLVSHDIRDVFTVTGGGAMYLNDSFGHHPHLHCTYNHNEQASSMAAEAYARIDNRIAAVCVTTGPGATNAITGVAGGWMDSIPMLVFSGQARYATTVYASGLKLRTRGVQEFDIIGSVQNMTKYCELVKNASDIRYVLEKAYHIATTGRPGPCWLDIPMDVQGAIIETDELQGYTPDDNADMISADTVSEIIRRIKSAERPVLFVGNGVRLAGAHEEFLKLVEKLNIPVVTGMSSIDAIGSAHRLYVGRSGGTGDRAGNFAVQNSDLLLSLGSRLSFFQTGFNYKTWARAAYKIINDIDDQELEKDSINADMKVCYDVKSLIEALIEALPESLEEKSVWTKQCAVWREKYPVVLDKHRNDIKPNIYAFYDAFTRKLGSDDKLVVSVGTSRVAGSQASFITEGMRFITNPSIAAMGYCLPAAIGVCVANNNKKTYLVTGDGSFQMNIQELQTIVQNKMPITVFLMNNQGYHSIRMTQHNYFGDPLVGVGPESHDLSFPDLEKLAPAYEFAFLRCEKMEDMVFAIDWAIAQNVPCICEMMLSTEQITEPKAASKRLEDGSMVSAPLEDMAPFLSKEELESNMYI